MDAHERLAAKQSQGDQAGSCGAYIKPRGGLVFADQHALLVAHTRRPRPTAYLLAFDYASSSGKEDHALVSSAAKLLTSPFAAQGARDWEDDDGGVGSAGA